MPDYVFGGTANYGQIAGILMLESTIPRLPGDPGHAETFAFPVRYGLIRGFPFQDLVDIRHENLDLVVSAALELEREGVGFIAADCGLFAPFQRAISAKLAVPFIGSPLSLIPLVEGFLPPRSKIGLITGDTRLLKPGHLAAAGADPQRLVIRGMEGCREFKEVVIGRGERLDPDALQAGVMTAAEELFLSGEPIGAVVLECTNLVSFRSGIQTRFNVPVFDMVSLIEFMADGYRLRAFGSQFIHRTRRGMGDAEKS